ncbi:MAG: hypothetical protein H6618_07380 [Deltaproteobacteria bacterium]|nr:hypothetical protein [Deltaproteobacteria bacterium]
MKQILCRQRSQVSCLSYRMRITNQRSQLMMCIFIAFVFCYSDYSVAADVSFGIISGESTGLSLHKKADHQVPAWHVSAFFQSREFLQFNGDLQFYIRPIILDRELLQGSFYSGIGLRAISLAHRDQEESYWIRFPAGFHLEVKAMKLQIFFELSGIVGALPSTKLMMSPVTGLRIVL